MIDLEELEEEMTWAVSMGDRVSGTVVLELIAEIRQLRARVDVGDKAITRIVEDAFADYDQTGI